MTTAGRAEQAMSLRGNVLSREAAVTQLPGPQLDSHHREDFDHKHVEEENVHEDGQDAHEHAHHVTHACTEEDKKKMPSHTT